MFAKELIGKTVLRERPVLRKRFIRTGDFLSAAEKEVTDSDYTYTANPVKIVAATDSHIIVESKNSFTKEPKQCVLNSTFCDDAWIDIEDLLKTAVGEVHLGD